MLQQPCTSDRKRRKVDYGQQGQGSLHHAAHPERWQEDWRSEEEEEEQTAGDRPGAAETSTPATKRTHEARKAHRRIAAEETAAAAAVSAGPTQTREQREQETLAFMRAHQNSNTSGTYASAWQGFERWVRAVENPQRVAEARIDPERPTETDVAAYCRHIVTVKGNTIGSAHTAIAAIADRLRYRTNERYNPCTGRILAQMIHVLTPEAAPREQKEHVSAELLNQIVGATAQAANGTSRRDACMFLLMFAGLLRRSELVRMNRGDVRIETDGAGATTMRVHINRLAKNDKARKGHERLFAQQAEDAPICLVRTMRAHLAGGPGTEAEDPLFATATGERLAENTPNHRLKHWLKQIGMAEEEIARYGSHSLRAGGATQAARAGVQERDIKQHGNWASDAVRVYLRPGTQERLMASEAIAQALNKCRSHAR